MEKPPYLSLLLLVLTEARIPNTLVILSAANGPLYWLLLLLVLQLLFLFVIPEGNLRLHLLNAKGTAISQPRANGVPNERFCSLGQEALGQAHHNPEGCKPDIKSPPHPKATPPPQFTLLLHKEPP